ncbi:MAG: bifunctional diaminohydroxyphosphoribosylaminopyrimidine deaminase/5-amino-6-(5-phosphoribosylamino)uracil reductase RibD [Thermodesulfobacteriota bacterium]
MAARPSDTDETFMREALRLARKGIGRTSPNPAVGAVVVKGDRIIGRGWHRKAGTPHAEIHALRQAGDNARGATIYVTLEPCNHTGRTPPCTREILASGISRVVAGMIDPNPRVAGSGCAFLRSHGVEVRDSVLADQCRRLNFPFIKHILTGLPWVIMKAGATLDGRIAPAAGQSGWITGEASRRQVHRLRNRVDAILIGSGTVLTDDPSLTTRLPGGKGRDPLRIVLDSSLNLPVGARMLCQLSVAGTWIFCGLDAEAGRRQALEKAGARVIAVGRDADGGLALNHVLAVLGAEQITSLLVEGGGRIHASFLRAGLVDQVSLFLAPFFLGAAAVPVVNGLSSSAVGMPERFVTTRVRRFGADVLVEGIYPRSLALVGATTGNDIG